MRTFEEILREDLKDPQEAAGYLNVAFEEYGDRGDETWFLYALRQVAEANGGMSHMARRTKLNRPSLYRALSPGGNPRLRTLEAILKTLGLQLCVKPMDEEES